jgi:phage tail sheath gpL-like
MTVPFSGTPSNLRAPFVAAEFDNSQASQGPALLAYKALILGQKLPTGSQAGNSLFKATNSDAVASACGRGSQLHRMAQAWFADNKATETWFGVLDEASAAVLATGSLAVTGPATAAGTVYVYVGGRRVPVAVASGDSASTIASAIATAIGKHQKGTVTFASAVAAETVTVGATVFTAKSGSATPGNPEFSIDTSDAAAAASFAAQVKAHAVAGKLVRASSLAGVATLYAIQGGPVTIALAKSAAGSHITVSGASLSGATTDTDLPVHADAASATVNLYAMNAGPVANECDVRLNYNDGEALPAGVGVAITAMNSGATNPTLTSLIAALGDRWFNVLANPFTDATSLSALEAELHDRFGPMRMIDGVMVSAKQDTYSNVGTLGLSRNSPHSCIFRANSSPTPPEEIAANFAGIVALSAANDPARPFQTLQSSWVKAPAETDQDTLQERNLLLYDGISTFKVGAGSVVQIERMITTYETSAAGSPDTSYLSSETMFTLMYQRYSWRVRVANKYPRHKLANDGTRFGAGQPIVTPSIMKTEAVTWFQEMEELGLVEDLGQFKTDLVVERDAQNPNRLNVLLPPNLINQLGVVATLFQFRE